MKILDLCCGCGGFSLGFKDNNNEFVGIDIWDKALKSYQANLNSETIQADIRFLDVSIFKKMEFDIIIGSPPCQQFSIARNISKRNIEKPDLSLIESFIKIKNYLKPRYWIMEEVPQVVRFIGNMAGKARILGACDFGLFHIRKRAFFGNFPDPLKKEKPKILLPTPLASYRGYFCHKKFDPEYLRDLEKKIGMKISRNNENLYKFLMGFPNDYFLAGNKNDRMRQLGNAVCPPVARAIYKSILNNKKLDDFLR